MDAEFFTLSKLEEFEKRLNSLNKKINTSAETLTTNINDLTETVTQLEGSGGCDTTAFFDCVSFVQPRKSYSIIKSDRISFICEKRFLTRISVEITVKLSTADTYTATLKTFFNTSTSGSPIKTETWEYTGDCEKTIHFDYDFYPQQENNYISFMLDCGVTSFVSFGSIFFIKGTIIGKNPIVLNRKDGFKVFISKENYYITKNTEEGGFYLLSPVSNTNLSSTFTKIEKVVPLNVSLYVNRFFPFNYSYIPKVDFNTTTQLYEIDSSANYFLFANHFGAAISIGIENPIDEVASLVTWSYKGHTYVPFHPGEKKNPFKVVAFINTSADHLPGLSSASSPSSGLVFLQKDGANVTGTWTDICPVFAKNWQDNSNRPFMCIATNALGGCYFFPQRQSTYQVYLGKGYQVNAYLENDDSITIYMTWQTTVYKKKLTYNSTTSQYELSSVVIEYPDALEIIGGYYDDYFINRLGTWEYVPPSTPSS